MSEIKTGSTETDLRPIQASKSSCRLRLKAASQRWADPPCTRFYRLVPCGLGTCRQESLLSYLDRLADRHGIPTPSLMRLFTEWEAHRFELKRLTPDYLVGDDHGQRMASRIARETSVPEVAQLVPPLFVRNRTTAQPNFRKHQAWCHRCCEEWAKSGDPVYRPFLWHLRWCNSCPVHHVRLQDHCADCAGEFEVIGPRHWSPHCQKCGCPLSKPCSSDQQDLRSPDIDHGLAMILAQHLEWCIKTAGLAAPKIRFPMNLETALSVIGYLEFQDITGITGRLVQHWRATLRLPELGPLLRLCYCFGLSMRCWLFETVSPQVFGRVKPKIVEERVISRRRAQSLTAVKRGLEAAAVDSTCPSIKSVILKLVTTDARVHRNFPELAALIRERHTRAKRRYAQRNASSKAAC